RAGARNFGKRLDDADQHSHCDCRQLSLGLCAGDILFVSLLAVRLVILRRALSWKFFAGAGVSLADDDRAVMPRNSIREFRNGFQAGRSLRSFSRRRLGAFFGSLLPDAIDPRLRRQRLSDFTHSAADVWA